MREKHEANARLVKGAFLLILFVALGFSFRLFFVGKNAASPTLQDVVYPIMMGALLGALATLCAAQLLHSREGFKGDRPVWFFPLLSGLLGLVAMAAAYAHLGMWPVGTKTGMIVDMHHQYAPLLAQLRDRLLQGDSLLYAFEVGLGSSFLPLFGYYLASPFNLLLLLFPESLLTEGILCITLLKNALCAAFFAAMLQTLSGKRDLRVCIVSLMYSLMMYLLAYSWNIMWLDCLMILPLIIVGFERLMRTGRYPLYVLTLFYALYANYYIGFMVCVFLVLYYISWVLRQRRTPGCLGRSAVRFGLGSLLGGGLAMALLLPVYFSLSATSAAGGSLPSEWASNFPALGLFEQLLYGATPTIRSGNLPNVYCGILAVLLLPVYFTLSAIPLRRRLTMGGLLAVVSLSAPLNIPDLIWHGLHAPNDLPYRFSFLISFVLLLIAYETLTYMEKIRPRQLGLSAAAVAILIFVLEKCDAVAALTGAEKAKELPFVSVYVSLLLVALYAGVLCLARRPGVFRRLSASLLLLVVTAEMTVGAGRTLDTLNKNEYFTAHENYVDNVDTDAIRLAVSKAKEIAAQDTANGPWRMEFLPRRTCVDTALFDYRGITSFASSNSYETTRLMGSLGYAINGVNSYLYRSFVPASDSLLGIRYVILESRIDNHRQLKLRDSVTARRTDSYGETEDKTLYIYENTAALPIAYAVGGDIHGFSYSYYSPFDTQNSLYSALTGNWDDLYTFAELKSEDGEGYTSGTCGFTVDGAGTAEFTARAEQSGQYFLFADCRAASSISVRCRDDSWDVSPGEPYIIDAGELSAGAEVTFTVTTDSTASGNLYVARLDTAQFDAAMAKLSANGMTVDTFTDTAVSGTLTATEDGAVMTSLVYDTGWTVTVDGKPVEAFDAGQGLLAFDVSAGTHTVEMTFFPRGLKAGLLISGVSLLLFLALVILRASFDRRQRRAVTDSESADALPAPEVPVPAENDGLVLLTDGREETAVPPAEEAPAEEIPVSEPPAPETPADGQAES